MAIRLDFVQLSDLTGSGHLVPVYGPETDKLECGFVDATKHQYHSISGTVCDIILRGSLNGLGWPEWIEVEL